MSQQADPPELVDSRCLPLPVTAGGHLWQAKLLDGRELATFASDRGISVSEDDVRSLWRLRLLRADLVGSRTELRLAGLAHLRTDRSGWRWYADHRPLAALREQAARPKRGDASRGRNAVPLFHPFRLYVLYHLTVGLNPNLTVLGSLFGLQADPEFNQDWHRRRRRWFGSSRFLRTLERWDRVAAVAIALEPVFYRRLFGVVRYSGTTTLQAHQRAVERHWRAVRRSLLTTRVEALEEIRRQIVFDADRLDDNTDLHMLIRLADHGLREGLKGEIGGAMLFVTMAEMIRRGAEKAFRKELPEEDAVSGSRSLRENAKTLLFGSTRILDNDAAAREFVRHHDLHVGLRVRWYVEGQTEAAMIRELLGRTGAPSIEIQNLHGGQFIQRHAVGFRERLEEDKRLGIFSFISLDGDDPLTLKVVRQAAADDLICGQVFVSDPDVEFGNFDREELSRVLWAASDGAPEQRQRGLEQAVNTACSGKELLKAAKSAVHPHLAAVDKGDTWGMLLGKFAAEHPMRGSTVRPIVHAVRLALAIQRQSHDWTLQEYVIDPKTLRPSKRAIPRKSNVRQTTTRPARAAASRLR